MPQVKVTIDDKIYKQLKKEAKDNFRTITNEINYRLQQSFTQTTPTYIPHGTPGDIPVEPYKITLSAGTTATPSQPTKTKEEMLKEKHPDWFTSDGTLKIVGAVDEEIEALFTDPTPAQTNDDESEPEPEWDADRGHTRP